MLNRLRLMLISLGGGVIALYMVWLVWVEDVSFSPWIWFILCVFLIGTVAMTIDASRTQHEMDPWADALDALGFASLQNRSQAKSNQWERRLDSMRCRVFECAESGQGEMRLELELEADTDVSRQWLRAQLSSHSENLNQDPFNRSSVRVTLDWVFTGNLAYCYVKKPSDLHHLLSYIEDLSQPAP